MTDSITILTHSRSRLAKLWTADGGISGYDETKNYSVSSETVDDLRALSALLTRLEANPRAGVIRGTFKGDEAAAEIDPDNYQQGLARKIKALYDDVPHHWALFDIDKYKTDIDPAIDAEGAITEFIRTQLPECFHDISYHWQLSSSAGHAKSAGLLSAHLWFWMARPFSSDELKLWASMTNSPVDKTLFNAVQFHYTAAPLAEPGVTIPVLQRSGLVEGLFGDEVQLEMPRAGSFDLVPMSSQQNSWDDDLLGLSPTQGWTLEYGRTVLFGIPSDSDRATWINDLAAFHHEFGGSVDAMEIAIEWSATASNFGGRDDVEKRWESFGTYRGGNPMTGLWLLKRRNERQVHLKYEAKDEWVGVLKAATSEFNLREKVCPKIAEDDRLDEMARETLAQALFDVFKRLGTKQPIAQCRKLVADRRASARGSRGDLPVWAEGWVYVTEKDQFYRIDSEEWLTLQGFNAKFNRELPVDEDGNISKVASWYALDDLQIPSVTRAVYLPWAPATFELFGVKCVNKYRPSSTPTAVAKMSAPGQAAVATVKAHLHLLAGGREEVVATLIDWLAHNVQQPGVKIRWSPLVKGVEGDGKTLLGSLLASVMGRVNVRNVSPKVLGTDFTSWAEGSCVVVLEEIKLTGHNRYDILNALKPFITNDSIEVHPKGSDPRDAINTVNYVAFTNYTDALPLTDTDRRWWIIFTPFATSDEMAAAVAGVAPNLGTYFDRLHAAINQHPAELRRWLLDHVVSETFKPNGSAPMTAEKQVMIGMSASDDEDTVRDILESPEVIKGITKTLFSSRCMSEALMGSELDGVLNTTSKNHLFKKIGFTKLPKKVKWNGDAHAIWVKGVLNLEPQRVREILDKTLPQNEWGSESDDLF